MFVAGYGHFLRTAASLQWDEAAVDLSADVLAWPELEPELRQRVARLVAGFCVAETAVAEEIEPFAVAADDPDVAACFEAQAIDEGRHARFFDRVAAEVAGAPGESAAARRDVQRGELDVGFLELFEVRLPAVARTLAAGAPSPALAQAVSLYHLLLEGVVFTAGQHALLRLLEDAEPALGGLRRGMELVLNDERWHIGFGARLLDDLGADAGPIDHRLAAEARAVPLVWGDVIDEELADAVLELHARRLRAAGLAVSRVPA